MEQIRILLGPCSFQHMTTNQLAIYKNHNGSSVSYDMISLFSLRPPELFDIFTNPVDYFRICFISERRMNNDDIEHFFNEDLKSCRWIDCLGCEVRIRDIGISELNEIVKRNIRNYSNKSILSDEEQFGLNMNNLIKKMLHVYDTPVESLEEEDAEWKETIQEGFIYEDENDLLPIPVLSNTSPVNSIQFLIHIILSLGSYKTEIDALCHANFRQCLRAVKLIGTSDDFETLKRDSEQLTTKFINEQLVFFPNSLNKAETFIVMSKGIFDDSIVHDAISINELPPFTMASLRSSKTEANQKFWNDITKSQLQAIYNILQVLNGIPSLDEVSSVSRDTPLEWDPLQTIHRNTNQSELSFEVQQKALQLNLQQINNTERLMDIKLQLTQKI